MIVHQFWIYLHLKQMTCSKPNQFYFLVEPLTVLKKSLELLEGIFRAIKANQMWLCPTFLDSIPQPLFPKAP